MGLFQTYNECFTPVNAIGIRVNAHALGLVIIRDARNHYHYLISHNLNILLLFNSNLFKNIILFSSSYYG